MNHTTLLMKMPDSLGDLEDDMTCQVLGKVSELNDLVEQFATFQNCDVSVNSTRPRMNKPAACGMSDSRSRIKK